MTKYVPTPQKLTEMFPDVEEKMQRTYLIADFASTSVAYRPFRLKKNKTGIVVFLDEGFTLVFQPIDMKKRQLALYYARVILTPPSKREISDRPSNILLGMQADVYYTEEMEADLNSLSGKDFSHHIQALASFPSSIFSGAIMGVDAENLILNVLRKLEEKKNILLRPLIRDEI